MKDMTELEDGPPRFIHSEQISSSTDEALVSQRLNWNQPLCISQLLAVMATIVMDRIGRLFISLQQIREVPRMLTEAAPSMPGTVRDTDVPHYFRERYICTGYRPLDQNWRYYFLSLFQRHNETINVWTHLLAFLFFLVKFQQLAETVDFVDDPHSWPLLVLILSSMVYSAFSAIAHLLGGKSELFNYAFFFLDYVGVAQYQYGSAVVHFYYAVDENLHRHVRGIFMPIAAVLSCLSCLGCCYGKYCNHSLPAWVRKVFQVMPSALAYMWDSSPVAKRLLSWSDASSDPAIVYHFGQVAFFLSCSFFFTCPLLERCFPGRCDFLGHSHQLFHFFLSCCTVCQVHASHLDYVARREVYSHLHGSGEAAFFAGLYVVTVVTCSLIAAVMLRKVRKMLRFKTKSKDRLTKHYSTVDMYGILTNDQDAKTETLMNQPLCISQLLAVMATIVMDRIGRLFISLQQIREVPRMLTEAAPSMPGTVRDTDVPHYFRERYICTGYRPLDQNWRYYFLSLFQRHNETINVWTHLLAFLFFLVKFQQLAETVDFVDDPHSWPLLVLILSSMVYSGFSATAHLLGGKSEVCHYAFFFLDYVGVAQYQYGSAVVHFYYAVDENLHRHVRGIFMPIAAVLSCLSCLGCCYGKYCNHSFQTRLLKMGQLVPAALAFFWDSSPVAERLLSWSSSSNDPAIVYHVGQVTLFLSSAFFFNYPVLERCFPGGCDFLGHSHQLFHLILSCCTLCQIDTGYLDYMGRRKLYSRLHGSGEAAVFVGLYVVTVVVCSLIAVVMMTKVNKMLDLKNKAK
ncbi:uncharacterized protein V6R79_002484 [Siganus canaliculatus]